MLWALWFVGVSGFSFATWWLSGWVSVGYCVDVCCFWFAFCMLIGVGFVAGYGVGLVSVVGCGVVWLL